MNYATEVNRWRFWNGVRGNITSHVNTEVSVGLTNSEDDKIVMKVVKLNWAVGHES
ncbi:MAG: hypothetical protein ACTS5A_01470 [Candidatus Hodgkinia cicadicola]